MGSINFNIGFAQETEPRGFIFKDIRLPIVKKESEHDIDDIIDITAVRNSVKNIFSWFKGQRVLNPEFGNPIYYYLYEPINEVTEKNIVKSIRNAFRQWEPRVSVQAVVAVGDPDQNEWRIRVEYSIPSLSDVLEAEDLVFDAQP